MAVRAVARASSLKELSMIGYWAQYINECYRFKLASVVYGIADLILAKWRAGQQKIRCPRLSAHCVWLIWIARLMPTPLQRRSETAFHMAYFINFGYQTTNCPIEFQFKRCLVRCVCVCISVHVNGNWVNKYAYGHKSTFHSERSTVQFRVLCAMWNWFHFLSQ